MATARARHMVMECGMSSEIGPVYVPDEKSAETRKAIDGEVGRMLREAYSRVSSMLVRAANPRCSTCLNFYRFFTSAFINSSCTLTEMALLMRFLAI